MNKKSKNSRLLIGSISIISAIVLISASLTGSIFYQNIGPEKGFKKVEIKNWDIIVPDNYKTIHEAIKNAEPRSKIFVKSGKYYVPSFLRSAISIDKLGIYLQGEDKNNTIISGRGVSTLIDVLADDVAISGFKLMHNGENGSLIQVHSINCTISDNILDVEDYYEGTEYGIKLYRSEENIIFNNLIFNADKALYMLGSDNNLIENNKFHNNFRGIEIGDVIYIDFKERITQRLKIEESKYNIIKNNTFKKNSRALIIDSGTENTIKNNNFYSENHHGLVLSYSKNIIVDSNNFFGCGIDIWGNDVSHYVHLIKANKVNGKELYYIYDQDDVSITKNAGQIILVECDDGEITDNIITNTSTGILLAFCKRIIIINCELKESYRGVYLYYSEKCKISSNNFIKNRIDAGFIGMGYFKAKSNEWKHNYWDTWIGNNHILFRLHKKRIYGQFHLNRPNKIVDNLRIGYLIKEIDRFPRSYPYYI
jgi:parallel beta-helix repeat protein